LADEQLCSAAEAGTAIHRIVSRCLEADSRRPYRYPPARGAWPAASTQKTADDKTDEQWTFGEHHNNKRAVPDVRRLKVD